MRWRTIGKGRAKYFEYSTERRDVSAGLFWCFIVIVTEKNSPPVMNGHSRGYLEYASKGKSDYARTSTTITSMTTLRRLSRLEKKDGDDDIQAYFAYIKDVDKEELEKEEKEEEKRRRRRRSRLRIFEAVQIP